MSGTIERLAYYLGIIGVLILSLYILDKGQKITHKKLDAMYSECLGATDYD